MQITKKEIDAVNIVLSLDIVKADYSEAVEKQIKEARKRIQMPGFRKGMVPASLVRKQYGMSITVDEVNKLINDSLYNYIRENKINVLGEPMVDESQEPVDFETAEQFTVSFKIAVAPEFELAISSNDKVPYYNIKATDEMIEQQIKGYQNQYGEYVKDEEAEPAAEGEEPKEPKGHVVPAELNEDLFTKVFGEECKDEAAFRAKVVEVIESQLKVNSEYRFQEDVRNTFCAKVGELQFPEETLKAWLLKKEEMKEPEKLDENFPKMMEDLKWQLIEEKIVEQNEIKVSDDDVKAEAASAIMRQMAMYGMTNIPEEYMNSYIDSIVKDPKQVGQYRDAAVTRKIMETVRGIVTIEPQDISFDDFSKMYEKK